MTDQKESAPNTRLGVVGVFVYESGQTAAVNQILAAFSHNIRGRLGVPHVESDPPISVIAIIFEGSTDELGALTGKLGRIPGIEAKSLVSKQSILPYTEGATHAH